MSKQLRDVYVVAATRTPIGKSGRGVFKNTRPDDLLVATIKNALKQVPTLDPAAIEDAIVGCAMPEGEQGMNVAKIANLLAGLPKTVAGVTINRFCASGITAVSMAADRIRVGEAEVMIAGGVESMSMVPMGGNKPSFHPDVVNVDENVGIAYGMGMTAEKVAEKWQVTREEQDAFATESHRRAIAAQEAGFFDAETTPIEIEVRTPNLETGEVTITKKTITRDEGARPDTSPEGLAKLRTVFAAKGSVTAGNSSQTSDGAGCLILASKEACEKYGLKPLAKFVAFAVKGVPPEIMGIGPIEAIPKALGYAGLKASDLDWVELNEAQREYAASDVRFLHRLREVLAQRLEREQRTDMAQACFDFLPTRARLDLAGWADKDMFSHD